MRRPLTSSCPRLSSYGPPSVVLNRFEEPDSAQLGCARDAGSPDDYRMLSDGRGGHLHLTAAVARWLVPGRNPFGLYLYRENVDALAAACAGHLLEPDGPSDKPWGTYEFALNGPDATLVRVGWPTRLRARR